MTNFAVIIIIIIIIKYIYIAQNRVMQLMRWVDSHTANKNVFSLCLNVSTEMSGVEGQLEDCSMSEVPVRRNCSAMSAYCCA